MIPAESLSDLSTSSLVAALARLGSTPLQSSGDVLGDADWEGTAFLGVACLALGAVAIKLGFDQYQTSQLVKNTAPERVRSVAVGRTELNGAARQYDRTYPQPFTAGECVYGRYRVKERVKEEDDDGETKNVWDSIATGQFGERLVLEDETGAIILDTPPVEYSSEMSTTKTQGKLDNLFEDTILGDWFDLGPDEQTARFLGEQGIPLTSSNRRQYEQEVISPGTELYALGQAVRRGDETDEAILDDLATRHETFIEDLVIERDEGSGEYIVSGNEEETLSRTRLLKAVGMVSAGLLCIVFGAAMLGVTLQNVGYV